MKAIAEGEGTGYSEVWTSEVSLYILNPVQHIVQYVRTCVLMYSSLCAYVSDLRTLHKQTCYIHLARNYNRVKLL